LIFIPQKVADRLKEYVRVQKVAPMQMIFPICYGAARAMVKKVRIPAKTATYSGNNFTTHPLIQFPR